MIFEMPFFYDTELYGVRDQHVVRVTKCTDFRSVLSGYPGICPNCGEDTSYQETELDEMMGN